MTQENKSEFFIVPAGCIVEYATYLLYVSSHSVYCYARSKGVLPKQNKKKLL